MPKHATITIQASNENNKNPKNNSWFIQSTSRVWMDGGKLIIGSVRINIYKIIDLLLTTHQVSQMYSAGYLFLILC